MKEKCLAKMLAEGLGKTRQEWKNEREKSGFDLAPSPSPSLGGLVSSVGAECNVLLCGILELELATKCCQKGN